MKRILILALIILSAISALAQRVELTGFGGYQYWGSVSYGNGKYRLKGGPSYGGVLGVEIRKGTFIDIMYNHQDSEVLDDPFAGPTTSKTGVGVNYITLSGHHQLDVSESIAPFAGLGVGMAFFDFTENYDTQFRLAINLGVGLKAYASEKIGLRFYTGFFAPMSGVGLGIGCGTGGCGAGVSTYSSVIQMHASGGLTYRIK
jgi:hypothetical protein